MDADERQSDTDLRAQRVQLEAYRRIGGAERVATVFRLNALARGMALAGIRRRHPDYDEARALRALRRLTLGDALVRRVFPDEELVDP